LPKTLAWIPGLAPTLTTIMLEYYTRAANRVFLPPVEADVRYKLELAGLVARAKCARVARISCDDGQQPGFLFDARLGDLLIVDLLDTLAIA